MAKKATKNRSAGRPKSPHDETVARSIEVGGVTFNSEVKIDGRSGSAFLGKQTGMPQNVWLYELFEANEKADPAKRLTDHHLQDLFFQEFGHHEHVNQMIEHHMRAVEKATESRQTGEKTKRYKRAGTKMSTYRSHYNRGQLVSDRPPVYRSFQYDSSGQAIARLGGPPINNAKLVEGCEKYGIDDPRIEDWKS